MRSGGILCTVFLIVLAVTTANAATYRIYDGAPNTGLEYETLAPAFNAAVAAGGDHTIQVEYSGPAGQFVEPAMVLGDSGNIEVVSITGFTVGIVPDCAIETGYPLFRNASTTGKTLTIRGASPANRFSLQSCFGVPVIDCGDATGNGPIVLENVVLYKEAAAPDGEFLVLDNRAAAPHMLDDVDFIGGNPASQSLPVLVAGPRYGDTTMQLNLDHVDFSGAEGRATRMRIKNLVDFEARDCVFAPAGGLNSERATALVKETTVAPDAGSELVFRDCSFESGTDWLFAQMGSAGYATPNLYKLYRPTFTGRCGGIAFSIADSGAELEILGLDDSDQPIPGYWADMDGMMPGGDETLHYATLTHGSIRFDHVRGAVKPGDDYGITSDWGALAGPVAVEMNMCTWRNGAGTYFAGTSSNGFAPYVKTVNTMFSGGGVAAYIDVSRAPSEPPVAATVELIHTTLSCPPGDSAMAMLVKGNDGDNLYGGAALFDAPGADGVASTSNLEMALATGAEWMNLAWDTDDPNSFGGLPALPNTGVIVADPALDPATGKLTSGSNAALGAAGSNGAPNNTALDFERESRPQPVAAGFPPDIGADEEEFPPTGAQWTAPPSPPGTAGDADLPGSLVGTLAALDPDRRDTHIFALLDDAGGRFALVNDTEIETAAMLAMGESPYTIVVRVTDSTGAYVDAPLGITVTDTTPPQVAGVTVAGFHTVDVAFSETMGAGVTDPANYTLSGSGAGTFLPGHPNPDSVAALDPQTYRLSWINTGIEMREGGDITITVAGTVEDAAGNPLGTPDSDTDAGGGRGNSPELAFITVQGPGTIHATFSERMYDEPALTDPANYTLTGSGMGTLAANPDTVTPLGTDNVSFSLEWASGEMTQSASDTVTITVVGVRDRAGNPIDTTGGANSASDAAVGTPPSVTGITAVPGNAIDISFSELMGGLVGDPASYTLSGAGAATLLDPPGQPASPDSVAWETGTTTYRLTWNDGEMLTGEQIIVEVDDVNVTDLVGNPLSASGNPAYGTGAGIAPTVTAALVLDPQHVRLSFSEPMQPLGIDTRAKYELVLAGASHTLAATPDTVTPGGGANPDQVELGWDSGALAQGEDVTAGVVDTYAMTLKDVAGNPLGTPRQATDTNRIRITAGPDAAARYIGDTHTFSVAVEGGYAPLEFRWFKVAAKDTEVGTGPTLELPALALSDSGSYYCTVTDARPEVVASETAMLSIAEPLRVVQQPQDGNIEVGDSFTFTVETEGGHTPLMFQWKKNGANVGLNSPQHTIAEAAQSDQGDYRVEVTDGMSTVESGSAHLQVVVPLPAAGVSGLALLAGALALWGGLARRGRPRG